MAEAAESVAGDEGAGVTGRRPRGSLSEEEILECAQRIVERRGLQGLSMPALARELKSGVTSIYWYFKSKEDLIQTLTDRVTHEIYRALPPIGDGPWDEEVIRYFVAFRDLLEEVPIYRDVFAYRARMAFLLPTMGQSMLRRLEDGLALFTSAGLTVEQALDAFRACSNYTRGYVLLEHGPDGEASPPGVGTALSERIRSLNEGEFPTLHQLGDVDQLMQLDERQFELGLRLLIDGIRGRHDL